MSFAPARLDVDPSIIDSNLKMVNCLKFFKPTSRLFKVENPLEESLFPASLLPQSKSRNKVGEEVLTISLKQAWSGGRARLFASSSRLPKFDGYPQTRSLCQDQK